MANLTRFPSINELRKPDGSLNIPALVKGLDAWHAQISTDTSIVGDGDSDTANNALHLGGKVEAQLDVLHAASANTSFQLGGKTEATLNVNFANTANSATNLNGQPASFYTRDANTSVSGLINTASQSLAGVKTFVANVFAGQLLSVAGNSVIVNGDTYMSRGGAAGVIRFGTAFGTTDGAVSTANVHVVNGVIEKGRSVASGAWINRSYSAGDYSGQGAMTVALTSGASDMHRNDYTLMGDTMMWSVWLDSITLGGTANGTIYLTTPQVTSHNAASQIFARDGNGSILGSAYAVVRGSTAEIITGTGGNWTTGASAKIIFTLTLRVA